MTTVSVTPSTVVLIDFAMGNLEGDITTEDFVVRSDHVGSELLEVTHVFPVHVAASASSELDVEFIARCAMSLEIPNPVVFAWAC